MIRRAFTISSKLIKNQSSSRFYSPRLIRSKKPIESAEQLPDLNQSRAAFIPPSSIKINPIKNNSDIQQTVADIEGDPNSDWFLETSKPQPASPSFASTTEPHQDIQELPSTGPLSVGSLRDFLVEKLKARNIQLIDMRDKCTWTQYMLVVQGNSESHIKRLSSAFYQEAKKRAHQENHSTLSMEGKESPDWQLVDLGSVIVHFFTPEANELYDLVGLWTNVTQEETETPLDATAESSSLAKLAK